MSNTRAIAAVTATIRGLLERSFNQSADLNPDPLLNQTSVTTLPPDEARSGGTPAERQLNIYLYQILPNAAYRNADVPRQLRPGETGQPPLALNLYYLLTAYATDDDQPVSHRILGRAMSVLHDHPVLGREHLESILTDGASGLGEQFERVRLSLQPLALEDIFKLWSGFQTHYRLSAAYEATVVLIDSARPTSAPLPVLKRGKDDQGNPAEAGVSLPSISEVRLPRGKSSASLGDELIIVGQNLLGLEALRFTIVNPRLTDFQPISIPSASVQTTAQEIKVTLPSDAAAQTTWLAGFYSIAVLVTRNQQTWSSNELPVSLAPSIEEIEPGNVVARDADGNVTITITCSPRVSLVRANDAMRFGQQVMLLLGTARQIAPEPPPAPPGDPTPPPSSTDKLTFKFHMEPDEVGEYLVRLRVDGVDSVPLDPGSETPQFAEDQKLEVT